jgi:predicted metal-dependent hydrolase
MEINSNTQWPPPYIVRVSSRAKRMSLRITLYKGLEVIIPEKLFKKGGGKDIPLFLEHHRRWVEKHLPKVLVAKEKEDPAELPEKLEFKALNQTWKIEYVKANKAVEIVERPHHELVVMGKIHYHRVCKKALQEWIKAKAIEFLTERTQTFVHHTKLTINQLSIRGQKTRWGSCSSHKNIVLNYKLIFLPEEFVDYVIIHELCHTVHLNHSKSFWKLVESFFPNYSECRKMSRKEHSLVPRWVEI